MPHKLTAPALSSMKGGGVPIVCVTAYDAATGALADAAGMDVILVGDSVGNTMLGYPTTVPVTMEEMLHHFRAVRRSVRNTFLIADMPFGSYQASTAQAVESAVQFMKAGAEAVKLEGTYEEAIEAISRAGIPVMGHVGMTPQSVHAFGGFKLQGKGDAGQSVLDAAKRVEAAGAFSIVLELIPQDLASRITADLAVPTIGIGAGVGCDGQIQVFHDLVGLSSYRFKHAKAYADAWKLFGEALASYASEVRDGSFPATEHSS